MKRYLITSLFILSGLFGYSAAAQQSSLENFSLMVGGGRIQTLDPKQLIYPDKSPQTIFDQETIKQAIVDIDLILRGSGFTISTEDGRRDLRLLVSILRDPDPRKRIEILNQLNRPIPEAFHGISGFSTALAVESVLNLIERPSKRAPVVKGQILEYVYDKNLNNGHLAVKMRIDHFDANDVLTKREILHWDVEIEKGGYKVVKRTGPRDVNNLEPFKDTIPLPIESRNPDDRRSIWVRGLDHKLFAKGMSVKVRNLYQWINDGPVTRFPDNHEVYKRTNESCVDIMFAGPPPALELPPQKSYCLGRCDKPYIVNTD